MPLVVAAHKQRTAVTEATGVNVRSIEQPHLVAQHRHRPASGARRLAAGVQGAAHVGDAGSAPIHVDAAAAAGHATRLHHAVQVQHGVHKAAARLGAHLGQATVGLQLAQNTQTGVQVVGAHVEEDQAISLHVHIHPLSRRQPNARCPDGACLGELWRYQGHRSSGNDTAVLRQFAGRAVGRLQIKPTGQHGGVCQVERCGYKRAHIHHRALAEDHATRIAQKYPAVGAQIAQDHRRIGAKHAVDQDGVGAGLHDVQPFAGAQRERSPIDAGAVAALHDRHLRTLGAHAGLAEGRRSTLRQRLCAWVQRHQHRGCGDGMPARFQAGAAGEGGAGGGGEGRHVVDPVEDAERGSVWNWSGGQPVASAREQMARSAPRTASSRSRRSACRGRLRC